MYVKRKAKLFIANPKTKLFEIKSKNVNEAQTLTNESKYVLKTLKSTTN